VWAFRITRDVVVDARPWVRAYLASKGKSPDLRRLVRGHWQRYWTKASPEPTWLHKEPYWHGPEGAAIAQRSHRIRR